MLNVPDSEVLAHEGWPIQRALFVAITRVENKTFGCAKMEYM